MLNFFAYHKMTGKAKSVAGQEEAGTDSGMVKNEKLCVLFDTLRPRGRRVNCTLKKRKWRSS